MIVFWVIIALMLLLAIGFIAWPLVKIKTEQVYVQRVKRDLGLILAIIIFPLAAIGLYRYWGSSEKLQVALQQQQQEAQLRAELTSPEAVITNLKAKLQQDPNSVQGWYLLGRVYFSQGQFNDAVTAYATANQLQPNNPELMMPYAQALYYIEPRQLKGKALELVNQVKRLQPDNGQLLNLLAIVSYDQGKFQQAIAYWQQLLGHYPPNSQDFQAIQGAIAQANNRLAKTDKAAKRIIRVTVAMDTQLSKQTQPDHTVYIYARAANGSKIPLAITRKQVRDLPMTVDLTEAMAMNPALTLASATKVIVVARVSQSGQATSQAGDLQGQTKAIALTKSLNQVKVTIDQVVR